jgi:mannose/cellobiose epimerase-like protein (N-acyl-D-glucosamine 2-epimerase family)
MPPDRIDAYLDKHLELWRTRGRDRQHGSFHERLSAEGNPLALGYKRLLVQCRQIFAHSLASRFGYKESAAAAQQGFAFLRRHYWDERHGGWFFSVTPEGRPHDRRKDLYGHAFVLLATAEYYKAFRDTEALKLAGDTVDVLEQHFAPAVSGGFAEVLHEDWEYQPAPRLQNPHMHLFEGFIALGEATGKASYIEHANALAELIRSRLVDAATGTIGEYFAADWQPDADKGQIVEPGHQLEWSWMLRRYAALAGGATALPLAEKLHNWATQHGFDNELGGIFDEVDRTGAVVKDSKRLWPLTECIKSNVALLQATPADAGRARLGALLDLLFERYLKQDGTWIEHFDRAWRPTNTELAGSTSYHIVSALLEAKRALETNT